MKTKWLFSKVHLAKNDGPYYNAVKFTNGKVEECDLPPTRSEVIGRKRVDDLNAQVRGVLVEVK